MTSLEVNNLHRSIYSLKNISTTFKGEQVKLIEISRTTDESSTSEFKHLSPGQIVFCWKSKKLLVRCADGGLIELIQLSIAKKKTFKVMSASDFLNGFLSKCEESEWRFE